MRKIIILIIAVISLQACKQESKDYVSFSGKLENNTDSILTISSQTFKKEIKINSDGTFNDTLKISKSGIFNLQTSPSKRAPLFLNNGYDLKLIGNADKFIESFKYSGSGSLDNNFIISQIAFQRAMGNPMKLFSLEKDLFDKKVNALANGMDSILNIYKGIDTTLIANAKKQKTQMHDFFNKNYTAQHQAAKQTAIAQLSLIKGKVSPKFNNYVNFKGGKTSLDSFKGKYVYIDVWATWCMPCIAEVPSLKKLEKQYHGKNIEFVSISIDDERTAGSWDNAQKKWRKMVSNKSLTGSQLYAGKDTQFIKDYQISSIPRFILIDPKGNIVDSNAPRPSDSKLVNLFNELGI